MEIHWENVYIWYYGVINRICICIQRCVSNLSLFFENKHFHNWSIASRQRITIFFGKFGLFLQEKKKKKKKEALKFIVEKIESVIPKLNLAQRLCYYHYPECEKVILNKRISCRRIFSFEASFFFYQINNFFKIRRKFNFTFSAYSYVIY